MSCHRSNHHFTARADVDKNGSIDWGVLLLDVIMNIAVVIYSRHLSAEEWITFVCEGNVSPINMQDSKNFFRFRLTYSLLKARTHTHALLQEEGVSGSSCMGEMSNVVSLCLISQRERWICCESNQAGNIHQWDLCLRNKHSSTSIGECLERQSRTEEKLILLDI